MEQMKYVLTEYAVYILAAWAAVMLFFAAVTLHRINKSIRMHKRDIRNLQETTAEILEVIEMQRAESKEVMAAAGINEAEEESETGVSSNGAENWTKEQEILVNAVLGEVFS